MRNIKNDTIKKLTVEELNALGVYSEYYIMLVKGTPKARLKGLKTTLKTDTEIHYENDYARYELIRTADTEETCYAVRCYDKSIDCYNFLNPVAACEFVK